jgi:hypothetical protein
MKCDQRSAQPLCDNRASRAPSPLVWIRALVGGSRVSPSSASATRSILHAVSPPEMNGCVAPRLPSSSLVALAGCRAAPGVPEPTTGPTATPPVLQTGPRSGLYLQNFDRSVRPQDDLYRFVNGTWLRETQIPADRAEYGIFSQIDAVVERQLKAIAEESAADPAATASGACSATSTPASWTKPPLRPPA